MSGYTDCACRDCFEIAISSDDEPALCHGCEAAGCEPFEGECCREDAYGVDGLEDQDEVEEGGAS